MGDFSLSKSALLALCGFPFRHDVEWPKTDVSTAADIGTAVQARVTSFINGEADPGIPETFSNADRETAQQISIRALNWAAKHRKVGWRSEVKLAWSPSRDEARELPATGKLRDYRHTPDCPPGCMVHINGDEIPGSTDVVALDDACVVVIDGKTGVTPLEVYRPQVRNLAMVAARRFGLRRARVELVKWYPDRDPESWTEELDGFALDALADDLRAQLAGLATAAARPGQHCADLFCPARVACPEVPRAIERLIPAETLVKLPKFSREFISHDHDASQLELVRLVTKAADDLKDLIKKRTPADGALLADGRVLREGFHDEDRWRIDSLVDLAKRLGATDADLEDCRYTFKKSEGLKITKPRRGRAA